MANPVLSLPRSEVLGGLEWTGPTVSYPEEHIHGDTYPVTWADDDELYMSAGDPQWQPGDCNDPAYTGLDFEKLSGTPPQHKITRVNVMPKYNGIGGWGPKPTGVLSIRGELFLAMQNLRLWKPPAHGTACQHGSDGFIIRSKDKGRTWSYDEFAIWELQRWGVMFPGHKFGGPAFVQFGKNYADAVDRFVYALSNDQWDNGSDYRLGRVPDDQIDQPREWRWVSDLSDLANPRWTADLEQAIPVLTLERYLGFPECVYLPHLKRYLTLTWHFHQDMSNHDGSDLIILESPQPWGPFSLVHFEEMWISQELNPYNPRVPLKWFDARSNAGWMLFSGAWDWRTGFYKAHVRPFRLRAARGRWRGGPTRPTAGAGAPQPVSA